ncbi:MAG TPA: ABC transporter permease [Gemmatimonadaceae bacterium]|nr:ABC transporter permease [Gemmatimonadaceae bacterium]
MSAFSDLVERLRAIVFRGREERELREELRFHVDMEAQQNARGGMDDGEARRRSFIALGGIERVKEDVRDARGTRLVEDVVADIVFTLRTLARSPGFAIVAILTLGLGIGGTTAVYSAVDAVLLQPLPYQQPGQLVRLYQSYVGRSDDRSFVTPVHFLDFRTRLSSFETAAAIYTYSESGADIGAGDGVRRIRLMPVSAGYFDVVRVHPALGHGFQSQDENGAPVVVLSHDLWGRQFHADGAVVGQVLVMNGKPYTVAGVMPQGFADPVAGSVDAWVPMDLGPGRDTKNATNHYLTVIARLRAGVTVAHAQAELDLLDLSLAKTYPDAVRARARLYPLKEDIVGSSSRALEIMLGAVALVLVLVCVNIANLLLVRGSERAREFSLRLALGAGRGRLVRQMLMESLTLALAGDIAGLVIARVAMSAIVALGSGSIPRLATLSLEPRLLAFSLAIASVSAIGFGLAPALRAGRTEPGDVLREQGRATTSGGAQMRLREWLVVSQVALAFVLLVGAGLLIASFQRLRQVDLGIQPEAALVFELNLPPVRYDSTARARFYEAFAKRVEGLGGVRAAGGVSKLPATGPYNEWNATALTGPLANTDRANPGAQQRVISGDYFRAAGIPVLEGRAFDSRDDPSAPKRLLVSKSLALQLFPGMSAIGQRLRAGPANGEIIGVVGDVALDAQGHAARYVYHAHTQFAGDRNWALVQVIRTNGSLNLLQAETRRLLAELDPQLVMYKPMALADAIGRGEAQRVFTLRILASFALVALALAALGLFGVLSYGVRLRAREFGIRMALGAEAGAIRRMVLRQGLAVTAIGIAIGLLGTFALARLMASVVFRVSPLEPVVLLGAVFFMAVVAGIAAYLPAHRATAADPRTVLQ